MKHLDHVRTSDYNSLTDFEKEALFKLIKEKHGLQVVPDVAESEEYIYLTVIIEKSRLMSTIDTDGYPLLSLEELREYVAMGMLL